MPGPGFALDRLRRWPDLEGPSLVAVDATDRLLLDEAAPYVGPTTTVAVIDDRYGALTLGATGLLGATDVRVHQDSLVGERALAANADRLGLAGTYRSAESIAAAVDGAQVVLLQLPRALAALGEVAELVAIHAVPDVVLAAGGRIKHMTRSMNDVLARCFTDVRATLARQKSRALVATGPREAIVPTYPRRETHPELGLTVVAHGAVFAGTRVDHGTALLAMAVREAVPGARRIVDLGCGSGVVACLLARDRPSAEVIASDVSAAAVASARATATANGLADRVDVRRSDALDDLEPASVDLVVCNPPFHLGAAVEDAVADRLFAGAARALRPGGDLWTVFNTSLHYGPRLARLVGRTRPVAHDARYTVTRSTTRP